MELTVFNTSMESNKDRKISDATSLRPDETAEVPRLKPHESRLTPAETSDLTASSALDAETQSSNNGQVARETLPTETGARNQKQQKVRGSIAGSTYVGLIIGLILLVILLVFILQNQEQTTVALFAWSWNFPVGVGMLFAAILGALITAFIGGWRMLELRRQVRKRR